MDEIISKNKTWFEIADEVEKTEMEKAMHEANTKVGV